MTKKGPRFDGLADTLREVAAGDGKAMEHARDVADGVVRLAWAPMARRWRVFVQHAPQQPYVNIYIDNEDEAESVVVGLKDAIAAIIEADRRERGAL